MQIVFNKQMGNSGVYWNDEVLSINQPKNHEDFINQKLRELM